MLLSLDHSQRLHLITALDALENVGRREGFAVCRLQEKLELSDAEREAIGLKRVMVDGRGEVAMWNSNAATPREYDLPEDDVKRLCNAIDKYPVVLGRDKSWWVPLTLQLPKPAESNGDRLLEIPGR